MRKRRNYNVENEFYCCGCGKRQPFSIPRIAGQERELGHLKRMYCFSCKKEINFVEVKPFSNKYTKYDFLLEYNYNNFNEKQERILPYGLFKQKLIKEGVDIDEEINNYVRSARFGQEYLG